MLIRSTRTFGIDGWLRMPVARHFHQHGSLLRMQTGTAATFHSDLKKRSKGAMKTRYAKAIRNNIEDRSNYSDAIHLLYVVSEAKHDSYSTDRQSLKVAFLHNTHGDVSSKPAPSKANQADKQLQPYGTRERLSSCSMSRNVSWSLRRNGEHGPQTIALSSASLTSITRHTANA